MDSAAEVLNDGRVTGLEKRVEPMSDDLDLAEPSAKRSKLAEVEQAVVEQTMVVAAEGAPAANGDSEKVDEAADDMSVSESEDYSFEEATAIEAIPAEKRGDLFEAYVAESEAAGKKPLEILHELGFKYLVAHLDTDEEATALIKRAIESAHEAKLELARQAADKLANGANGEEAEVKPTETSEAAVIATEAAKVDETVAAVAAEGARARPSSSAFLALLGGDLDDSDLDDSDDGSYDATEAVFAGDFSDDDDDGDLLTDPVEILGVISSHIRNSEDHMPPRRRLPEIQNEEDVVRLIENANKIVVLSGAGISVACGVPDFRSPGGLYDQIKEKYNLTDPQLLFDITYIRKDQVPFYDFAAQLFPSSDLVPSKAHKFIKLLQDKGKLLRNYSQNIDTLEQQVGIKSENLILCHGSFATFSCPAGHKFDGAEIKPKLDSKHIPQCEICNDPTGTMFLKPDIVFFGEALPETFRTHVKQDVKEADLLIVMGSSLRVQPVALVPRTSTNLTLFPLQHFILVPFQLILTFDVCLLLIFDRLARCRSSQDATNFVQPRACCSTTRVRSRLLVRY